MPLKCVIFHRFFKFVMASERLFTEISYDRLINYSKHSLTAQHSSEFIAKAAEIQYLPLSIHQRSAFYQQILIGSHKTAFFHDENSHLMAHLINYQRSISDIWTLARHFAGQSRPHVQ